MKWSQNTILLTGGSAGFGLELAGLLLERGNRVIATGRRPGVLERARQRFPDLLIRVSDAGAALEREALVAWLLHEHPDVNVLINNAGAQYSGTLSDEPWHEAEREIATNLEAPIHLAKLLIDHFRTKPAAHIINVSSGLAFAPIAHLAIYCATKAALHSVSLSLRHQLRDTKIGVTEIIPPALKTGIGNMKYGVDTGEFARAALGRLDEGKAEVTYGRSTERSRASRAQLDEVFAELNR